MGPLGRAQDTLILEEPGTADLVELGGQVLLDGSVHEQDSSQSCCLIGRAGRIVGRGSHDPARVPDRGSHDPGECPECRPVKPEPSRETYGRADGGVRRPAPSESVVFGVAISSTEEGFPHPGFGAVRFLVPVAEAGLPVPDRPADPGASRPPCGTSGRSWPREAGSAVVRQPNSPKWIGRP